MTKNRDYSADPTDPTDPTDESGDPVFQLVEEDPEVETLASTAYTAFITVYVISAAEMKTALLSAGSRCDAILRALSPYASSSTVVPRTLATYGDSYSLNTAAKVNAVLAAAGPRGHKFLSVLETMKAV